MIVVCGHLRVMQGLPIGYYWGLSQKNVQTKNLCMSQHIQVYLGEVRSVFAEKNTHMRETISVESRIAMSLQRLGTGNTLYTVGEVYGMAENIILEVIRIFCKLVRVHLQGIFVQFPSLVRFGVLA